MQKFLSPYPFSFSLFAKLLFCIFTTTIATNASAQGWHQSYDSHFDGGGLDLMETSDGGFIVAGFNSSQYQGNGSYRDHATLTKVDAEGELQWEYHFGDDRTSYFNDMLFTSDGNYLMAGSIDYESNLGSSEEEPWGQGYVVKTDQDGNLIWAAETGTLEWEESFFAATETSDGNFMLVGWSHDTTAAGISLPYDLPTPDSEADLFLAKINSDGDWLWTDTIDIGVYDKPIALYPADDEGAFLWVYQEGATISNTPSLLRLDADGNELWRHTYTPFMIGSLRAAWKMTQLSSNEFVIAANSSDFVHLMKMDTLGNTIWAEQYEFETPRVFGMTGTDDGGFVITGIDRNASDRPLFWMKTDAEGSEEFRYFFDLTPGADRFDVGGAVLQTSDGSLAITGMGEELDNGQFIYFSEMLLIKTFPDGSLYPNDIIGRVFQDENNNCAEDTDEPGYAGWLVTASDGTTQRSGTTDTTGAYNIDVPPGNYEVTVAPLSYLYGHCPGLDTQIVVLADSASPPALVNFPMEILAECPLMTVDLSSPALIRCFSSTYFVEYCNIGTAPATDAYVLINLDEYINIESATLPYINQGDTLLRFDIGDVAVDECGGFEMAVLVDCDSTVLGQMHCSQAHIYPDTFCLPPPPEWDMSSIALQAECEGDSVYFLIINEGTGNMSEALEYFIVVDEVIMFEGDFQLEAGKDTLIVLISTATTYRMEAEQSEGHPGQSMPSVSLENCQSMGAAVFFNWFSQNDEDFFIDIDCLPNVGGFDPNDKQAFPRGYDDEHFIEASTPIDYTIRFQNTGTYTAFTVVIRDTISPYLDLSTIQMGASSHPYRWQVLPWGMLKITFDDIMLPDSTTNEEDSHGFVKFKIKPFPDIPLGSVVENNAAIYFDFNPPVITNTVFHTIGEDFIQYDVVSTDTKETSEKLRTLRVFPNPSNGNVIFELPNGSSETNLRLYDALGNLQKTVYSERNHLFLIRENLPAGIYFYQINNGKENDFSGKLIFR